MLHYGTFGAEQSSSESLAKCFFYSSKCALSGAPIFLAGMRPQIRGSSKTTAFYLPIGVDHWTSMHPFKSEFFDISRHSQVKSATAVLAESTPAD